MATTDKRLDHWQQFLFEDSGFAFPVYRKSPEGVTRPPAIIVMHEVPGIYPAVIDFAERLLQEGYCVYLPSLLGEPGKRFSLPYVGSSIARACISREFQVLALRQASPITDALRALCRQAHAECGGVGVGAIGMCLTGNFALALMVDESVMAPVLAQPSLPFAVSKQHKRDLHVSDAQLQCIKQRVAAGPVKVLGLRFSHDAMSPPERFARLREELGAGFEGIEIDSGPGNPAGIARTAHSVVTKDLVDVDGHPTQAALQRLLDFFAGQLRS
ncbi:dienelactone hydrolase family protein [Pseudomonas sp. N040]|uniref:dienelactone hydrolase family protein n=1 Tax=Pseudomonas sp. N040 TaxID=2785325 RepID=UPI0018A2A029|nr:dienelactone hydrolase family protein [Pseudomonas sp. N040]MBF7731250.1 dienelactone hydrolase family protein [Pseudomonas sp. N040]MBW7014893.1 dienelactone hydrolase family protein [Pseudomonas sp. N040]